MGGLGNQMFEYAAARHLSIKNKTNLKFNDFTQKEGIKRDFHLNMFNTAGSRISEIELSLFKLGNRIAEKFPNSLTKNFKYLAVGEVGSDYNANILEISESNVYLTGFWQSDKYFKDIEDTIRSDFKVKPNPNEYSKGLLDKIQSSNSVFLHVRRGDYVANPDTAKYHGVMGVEYFNEGIKYIKEHVDNPNFFLFSDDPDWAKENIITGCPTEVSYNPASLDYEDIRLMYSCKHAIIANSTLSWWGAWLIENKDKIIIAPKRWFASDERSDKDLVPANWLRI